MWGADDHLQDDLALDSMDVLNFVAALHERFGVDVPEREYPQIATLSVAIGYLGQRIGVAGRGGRHDIAATWPSGNRNSRWRRDAGLAAA
jgi:acyl carrier protein